VEQVGSPAYLDGLSEIAGRSFDSVKEAKEALLQLLSEQLGMRSAFPTRVAPVGATEHGISPEVAEHPEAERGFVLLRQRPIVECCSA